MTGPCPSGAQRDICELATLTCVLQLAIKLTCVLDVPFGLGRIWKHFQVALQNGGSGNGRCSDGLSRQQEVRACQQQAKAQIRGTGNEGFVQG